METLRRGEEHSIIFHVMCVVLFQIYAFVFKFSLYVTRKS